MIIPTTAKTKCDCHNCKNDAAVFFAVKGKTARCYLCKDCLQKLAAETLKETVPKSPQNTIKRLSDKRETEANLKNA